MFPLNPSVGMIPSLNNRHSKSNKGKMENPSNQLLCYKRERNLNWKHGKKKNWWSTDSSCPLRIKHLLLIIPRICYEWTKPYPIPLIIKKSTFNKQKHTPYQTSQKGCTNMTHKCNRKSFNGGNSIYPISILTKNLTWAIIWHHRKHYLDIFSETKMTKQLQSPPFSR